MRHTLTTTVGQVGGSRCTGVFYWRMFFNGVSVFCQGQDIMELRATWNEDGIYPDVNLWWQKPDLTFVFERLGLVILVSRILGWNFLFLHCTAGVKKIYSCTGIPSQLFFGRICRKYFVGTVVFSQYLKICQSSDPVLCSGFSLNQLCTLQPVLCESFVPGGCYWKYISVCLYCFIEIHQWCKCYC